MANKPQSINPSSPSELRSLAEERLKQKHLTTQYFKLSTLPSPEEMRKLVHELDIQQIELEIQQEELAQTRLEFDRITRILRATTDCNQALIHSSDEMELVQKICNIVVDIGGYRMAWIGYAEHDKEKSVRPVAQSGFEEGYLETAHISWDDTEFGRGPTGTSIRTGKSITILDIINDPRMKPWHNDAMKRGYASSLSLPLKADQEVFGAFMIYSSHPRAFNAEETELHTTLADNLAYGISMLRTRLAHQKAQEALFVGNERMHFIMNATNTGFWEHDMRSNTNTWSEEVWKLYGLKPDSNANTYERWISTIIPEDREMVEQAVLEAVKTTGDYSCRWRTPNPDGTIRWLLSKGTPLKDSQGTILRYAGLVLDITDQKQKEDALTESEDRFRTLFKEHSSVMLIIDPETGSIIDANRAAANFYGWSVETLKQKQIHQLTTNSPEKVTSQMEKFKKAEQNHNSFRHRLANGSIRDVDVFCCPITFEGKTQLYSIINDITDRKLAEQAILNSLPCAYLYCRVLYDQGIPVDLMHEEVNVSWKKLTGLKDVTGLRFTEIFPGIADSNPEFFNRLLKVAESGAPDHFETYLDSLGKWYDCNVYSPEKGTLIAIIEDITERKQAEDAIKHSEERFRSLFEEHSSIMFMYDVEGNIVDANKAAANYYGWSIDELRQMSIRQINTLSPEGIQGEIEQWRSQKQKHKFFQHRRADGSIRDIELFAKKIRIKDRDLITAIIHDVTDQKRYERVYAFRIRLLLMADTQSIEGLLQETLDEAQKITGSSIGFFFFIGKDEKTLTLQLCSTPDIKKQCLLEGKSVVQDGVWADILKKRKAVIHNEGSTFKHCDGIPQDQAEIKRDLLIPVIRDGKTVSIIGVGNKQTDYDAKDIEWLEIIANNAWDIVAKKMAEEENKKLVAQLQHASKMEMIGQLAGGIAHEINNPLNFITINEHNQQNDFNDLQELVNKYREIIDKLIAGSTDTEEVLQLREKERMFDIDYLLENIPKTLKITLQGLERITAITRSMRNYSFKNEQGGLIPSDINKAVNESILMTKSEYRHVATIDLHLEELPLVLCDLASITQVLLNLIVNSAFAIQSQNRSTPGTITIKTWATSESVCCSVADDGVGISEEVMSRIFEPFFTTKEIGQGTGLGLSISYDIIVNKHKGNISAESLVGGGSVFTVSLPLR